MSLSDLVANATGNINALTSSIKSNITNIIANAKASIQNALSSASAATSNALQAASSARSALSKATASQSAVASAITKGLPAATIAALQATADKDTKASQTAQADSLQAASDAQAAQANLDAVTTAANATITTASNSVPVSPYAVLNNTPVLSTGFGFKDPSGRYPLVSHSGESDSPRLATCENILSTIVSEKNDDQNTGIPVANGSVSWNQSPPAYNAQYPYNTVFNSESGHVLEFDDTKGSERINIHHMAGTFIEIDGDSNLTNKVKGIRTIIVDSDDLLYISGSGHVSIDGDMSVLVGGQCQIQVLGNANISVGGNLTQTVAGDFTQQIAGNYYLEVGGNCKIASNGVSNYQSGGDMNMKSGGNLSQDVKSLSSNITGDINLNANGTCNITGNSAVNILSSGVTAIDGSSLSLEAGDAIPATTSTISLILAQPIPLVYSPTINTPTPTTSLDSYMMLVEGSDNLSERASLLSGQTPLSNNPSNTIETAQEGSHSIAAVMTGCDFGTLSLQTQLSRNFKLSDLLGQSGNPFPFGVGQHNLTDAQIVCNLRKLCLNILEPLRDKYSSKGFKINSGYRNSGSIPAPASGKVSQHELGQAVDISFSSIRGVGSYSEQVKAFYAIAKEINAMGLPYDQMIFENNPATHSTWIHMSYSESAKLPRSDGTGLMSFYGGKYLKGLVLMN